MAILMDERNDQFAGEAITFDCIKNNLPNEVIAYYNREIKGLEFDFCLLIQDVGILILEVKGWQKKDVLKVENPDKIFINGYSNPQSSPKKQARSYRFCLLNEINDKLKINPIVLDAVCYPFLSKTQYMDLGLNIVSDPKVTFFQEDINTPASFASKIISLFQTSPKKNSDKLNTNNFALVRSLFENPSTIIGTSSIDYSHLLVFYKEPTLSDINHCLNNYFNGTKQIIFSDKRNVLECIINNLNNILNDRKMSYQKGHFVLNSNQASNLAIKEKWFSIFNLDMFLIDDLSTFVDKNILITNGVFDSATFDILKKLANKSRFNLEQYCVEHAPVDKNIQVTAGAGTGKTYSMISRISYICSPASGANVILPSSDIAMMTFTVDAAVNMKNRLKVQFMNYFMLTQNKTYLDLTSDIERMRISTIHSFAKDVISRTTLPLGIGTDFNTVSGDYKRSIILKKVLNNYLSNKAKTDPDFFYRLPLSAYKIEDTILQFINKVYSKGCDIKEITKPMLGQNPTSYLEDIIFDVVVETEIQYAKDLIENNSVSLEEYMFVLNKCIADDSFNKNNFEYKYLFVDEFQDVDDIQIQAFVEMQKKLGFYMFIVGDLKQSIYRFRGATMSAFDKIGCNDLSAWKSYSLTTNYRTDARLLTIYDSLFSAMGANNLLIYNQNDVLSGVKNNTIPSNELAVKIPYVSDEKENGAFYDRLFLVVKNREKELKALSSSMQLSQPEKTIAILVRTNSQIKTILSEAKKRGVSIESDSNGNLYKSKPAIDLCKLTSALCNPYNDVYLFDLILSNNINTDFKANMINTLSSNEKKQLLIECLDKYYLSVLNKKWADIVNDAQTLPILKVLRDIFQASKPWKLFSNGVTPQMYYRVNYELLFEELANMNKTSYLTLNSINEMLTTAIKANMEANDKTIKEDNDTVKIICTTVHKSKGLEYDTVILPETSDSISRLKRNALEVTFSNNKLGYLLTLNHQPISSEYYLLQDETVEMMREESRILYVALTRAINKFIWFKNSESKDQNWGTLLEEVA